MARYAHAKRTCGPLLFVIGTPNAAALHWRGCWQLGSNPNQVLNQSIATITERNSSPVQVTGCGAALSPPIRTSGSRNANAGEKKFRCLSAKREARYFPRNAYRRCLPAGPVVRVATGLRHSSARARTTSKSKKNTLQTAFSLKKYAVNPSKSCSTSYEINSN